MHGFFRKLDSAFARVMSPFWFAIALATRLALGLGFFMHGKAKFSNLEQTTKSFEGLGIPMPNVMAPFVSGLELLGGVLLVIGLATRPIAALLSVVMVVALVTRDAGHLGAALTFDHQQHSFLDITALAYLLLSLWIWAYGPGRLSVDAMMLDCPPGELVRKDKRS